MRVVAKSAAAYNVDLGQLFLPCSMATAYNIRELRVSVVFPSWIPPELQQPTSYAFASARHFARAPTILHEPIR